LLKNFPMINSTLPAKLKAVEEVTMTSATYWLLFCETGEPMYYLLYCEARDFESTEEKTA